MKLPNGVSLTFATLLILSLAVACAQPAARADPSTVPGAVTPEPTPTVPADAVELGGIAASYIAAQSLDELVAQSVLICVGQVSGTGTSFNMAMNPSDRSKTDPQTYILGQVYHAQIQRCLKGEAGQSIDIVQPESALSDRVPFTSENIEKARGMYKAKAMSNGRKYLLFLQKAQLPSLPETQGKTFWAGTAHPWRFAFTADGQAEAESPWEYASLVFPARSQAELIGQVERLVNARR